MPWSISLSAEGWAEIREQLETWDRDRPVTAITDDTFEKVFDKAGEQHATRAAEAERTRLETLPLDLLVDRACDLVERNDTCDAGGWAYWIDREGYHKVFLAGPDET